jgi:hypothetical protein
MDFIFVIRVFIALRKAIATTRKMIEIIYTISKEIEKIFIKFLYNKYSQHFEAKTLNFVYIFFISIAYL